MCPPSQKAFSHSRGYIPRTLERCFFRDPTQASLSAIVPSQNQPRFVKKKKVMQRLNLVSSCMKHLTWRRLANQIAGVPSCSLCSALFHLDLGVGFVTQTSHFSRGDGGGGERRECQTYISISKPTNRLDQNHPLCAMMYQGFQHIEFPNHLILFMTATLDSKQLRSPSQQRHSSDNKIFRT